MTTSTTPEPPATPKRTRKPRDTTTTTLRVVADGTPDADDTAPKGPNNAQRLVKLAHEIYELGMTKEGRPFVIERGGPNAARWLRGGTPSVIGQLSKVLHQRTGIVSTGNARTDALALLTAQAEECERVELTQRVARHGDGLVLDLADQAGRAVVVTGQGWSVVDRSPVPFTRSLQTLPLPVPVRGGSVADLWPLVNIADSSRDLYVACVLSHLFRYMDHPILDLSGEAGTGKSTTARNTARLIDPSAAPLARMPTHEKDLDIVASQSYVLAFDNLSRIEDWQSDALCTFCTGVSSVRRALFTDSEMALLTIRLCVILTSIDYGTPKADLAQRLLPIRLSPLAQTGRRDETRIDTAFAAVHPRVLGALLDLAVSVLAELPAVDAAVETGAVLLPRLAGFGKILAALDRSDGRDRLGGYHEIMSEQAADVATEDEVATALRVFAREHRQWQGTPLELHTALTHKTMDTRSRYWPETVVAFGKRVSVVVSALREVGVRIEKIRVGSKKERRTEYVLSVIESTGNPDDDGPSGPDGGPDIPSPQQPTLPGSTEPCQTCQWPGPSCGHGSIASAEAPCVACGQPTAIRSRCGAARTAHCSGPASLASPAPATPPVAPVPAPNPPAVRAGQSTRTAGQRQTRTAAQNAATTAARAALNAGNAPNLLDELAGPFLPRRKDATTGVPMDMRRIVDPCPVVELAHVPADGHKWVRPFAGDVTVLDRSGAWISSAASVRVAHGALTHTGAVEFDKRPGYYLVHVYPWYEPDMPSPLGDAIVDADVWVPQATVALLADLVAQGRWPDVDLRDSWTSDEPVRLSEWTGHVNTLREHGITAFGRDDARYGVVKSQFGTAFSMMKGRANPGGAREYDGPIHRTDITHEVQAHCNAELWRRADYCRQAAPEFGPVELRGVDELLIPFAALTVVSTATRANGRPVIELDPTGIKLGTFKVKGTETRNGGRS